MKMSVCNKCGVKCYCSGSRVGKSLTIGWGPYLAQAEGRDLDGRYWSTMSQHSTASAAQKAIDKMRKG